MHYYQHHIGDFIRDTSRLSDEQCMAYMRMIWLYYESELPLPNNPRSIAFRVGSSEDVVQLILESFFKLEDGAWRHTRCDSEIAEYEAICNRNRTNGKAGGRPKKTQSVSSGLPDDTDMEPIRNPIQYPVTSNQEDQKHLSPDGDGKPVKPDLLQGFAEFWIKYPRKTAKQDAEKAWAKLKPSAELQSILITAVDQQAKSLDWTKDGGKFIPHPATWLNGKRWEDQLTDAPLSKHGDFDKRDYYAGLTQREDGTYAF